MIVDEINNIFHFENVIAVKKVSFKIRLISQPMQPWFSVIALKIPHFHKLNSWMTQW